MPLSFILWLSTMTEQQKAQSLREKLKTHIASWDIAWFLRDETYKFIGSLNSWKLEKLASNLHVFKKYVYLLDDQNTKQMANLLHK